MSNSNHLSLFLILLGLFTGISGCGGGDFPTAKTSGVVLCDGQPLADAFVYFEPLEQGGSGIVGKGAFARTGADGRFVLTTYKANDGAVVGRHRVRVDGMIRNCPCRLSADKDVMQVEIEKGSNEFEISLPLATQAEKQQMARTYAQDQDD